MKAKLETLSVSVLREFAKDKNIKNISTMRKSELIDAIIDVYKRQVCRPSSGCCFVRFA